MAWAPKEFDASQAGKGAMSDWLHNLPIVGMALVVFGAAYLLAAIVHIVVTALAIGERARSFKAFSPGMLSPLGVLVGLLLAFTAAQVWSDNDRAAAAVNREASALKSVLVFAAAFPGEPEARLRTLVRQYIEETATQEWPMMAHRSATLSISPRPLADSLMLAIGLPSGAAGQQTAQREIIASLESALDARRQRILVSRSEVNPVRSDRADRLHPRCDRRRSQRQPTGLHNRHGGVFDGGRRVCAPDPVSRPAVLGTNLGRT
jgi:hypothetical protein